MIIKSVRVNDFIDHSNLLSWHFESDYHHYYYYHDVSGVSSAV